MTDCVLWYRRPAARWTEALPIGNGRLGAMVFGGIGSECWQLNEHSLWTGGPEDADNPAALKLYRSEGFAEIGRREGYYARANGEPATALVMARDLG